MFVPNNVFQSSCFIGTFLSICVFGIYESLSSSQFFISIILLLVVSCFAKCVIVFCHCDNIYDRMRIIIFAALIDVTLNLVVFGFVVASTDHPFPWESTFVYFMSLINIIGQSCVMTYFWQLIPYEEDIEKETQ